MKKLLICAAFVCVATVVNAAAINWSFDPQPGVTQYANAMVYAVSASDYSAAIKDLTENAGAGFSSYVTQEGGVALNPIGSGTSDATLKSGDFQFALFVFKEGIAEGNPYVSTGLIGGAGNVYEPPAQCTSPLSLGVANSAFTVSGTINTTAAPEPTSAMLLLLGVAGLALKRKAA